MPVVIIPLFASLVVGILMFMLLGRPLAAITSGLTDWLSGMSGTSAVLLGVILGLMMCFDLGGPVNKAAYAFATAGLTVGDPASFEIMAAVMAAGMVPPLAMALATFVRPRLFSEPERENGRAAWLLGACFISEGAIPFAAADPFRVIPSMMFGGAITGALMHGLRRHARGRRTAASSCSSPSATCSGSSSPSRSARWRARSPSSPPSSSRSPAPRSTKHPRWPTA